MTEPWRTARSAPTTSFDPATAVRRSRVGLGNIVRYGFPFILFLYLKLMGASFLFAGCAAAIAFGAVYIPLVMGFIHLDEYAGLLSFVWLCLCVTMYAKNTDLNAFGHEIIRVWTNSLALVESVLNIFKALK